jgi:undecaprenyl-diphosphatase
VDISTLKELDTQLFLFLNSKHNALMDTVMYWVSHKFFWIPLYIYFLSLAYKKTGKQIWLVLVAATLLILISDQVSVHAFKNVFLRYRPCHNLTIQSQVHLLNGHCGGTYGFVSSHATNTFALVMFLVLVLKNNSIIFSVFMFSWAALVAYSRIYAGVHYPADVVVGAILGMGIGIAIYKLYEKAQQQLTT